MNLLRPDRIMIREELYIRGIISNYNMPLQSSLLRLRLANHLTPLIKAWAAPYIPQIIPTGSLRKGTCIRGATDIDLLISLPSTVPDTLGDIYWSLDDYLRVCRIKVREQNVSIRVTYKGLLIDLIPAKKQSAFTYDHSIYRRKAETWTKTNVHKHVQLVKESGRLNEIRGIKIWRQLHNLEFPSFYLELSVIEALHGHRKLRISSNLRTVFEYLAEDFADAQILDPSNSKNIISNDLNDEEKQAIVDMATSSLSETSFRNIIW